MWEREIIARVGERECLLNLRPPPLYTPGNTSQYLVISSSIGYINNSQGWGQYVHSSGTERDRLLVFSYNQTMLILGLDPAFITMLILGLNPIENKFRSGTWLSVTRYPVIFFFLFLAILIKLYSKKGQNRTSYVF